MKLGLEFNITKTTDTEIEGNWRALGDTEFAQDMVKELIKRHLKREQAFVYTDSFAREFIDHTLAVGLFKENGIECAKGETSGNFIAWMKDPLTQGETS